MSVKRIRSPPPLIRHGITLAGLIVFSLLENAYPLLDECGSSMFTLICGSAQKRHKNNPSEKSPQEKIQVIGLAVNTC